MRRLSLVALLLLVVSAATSAQTSSKGVVAVEPMGPGGPVAAGTSFDGSITLRIKAGYHINAQKPTEDYLIGTSVKMSPPAGITVTKTAYPSARFAKFSFAEEPLAVYEATVKITVTMKIDAATAAGPLSIPGKLTFQACNDSQCLPPSTVDISIPVEVSAATAGATEEGEVQTLTLAGAPPDARVTIDGKQAGRANAQGRFVAKDLKRGRYRVRVEQDGFAPWEQTVSMNGTDAQTVNVVLTAEPIATDATPPPPAPQPAPTPVTPAAPAAVETAPTAEGSNLMLYALVAVAVLTLAAAGAYMAMRSKSRGRA